MIRVFDFKKERIDGLSGDRWMVIWLTWYGIGGYTALSLVAALGWHKEIVTLGSSGSFLI